MSLVDQILGRAPVQEDDSTPPMMATRPHKPIPARTKPPEDDEGEEKSKDKARHRSVVASIMGMTESEDEAIIPDSAKPLDSFTGSMNIPGIRENPLPDAEGPSEPAALTNQAGEELIQPTAALVAPDVTPNAMVPIDPSSVPAPANPVRPPMSRSTIPGMPQVSPANAEGTMNTILGRQNGQPQPEEAMTMAESFIAGMADPIDIKQRVAEAVTPAQPGTSLMPEHKEGDGKSTFNSFRRFMR